MCERVTIQSQLHRPPLTYNEPTLAIKGHTRRAIKARAIRGLGASVSQRVNRVVTVIADISHAVVHDYARGC